MQWHRDANSHSAVGMSRISPIRQRLLPATNTHTEPFSALSLQTQLFLDHAPRFTNSRTILPQVSGADVRCVCNNACRLEGRQLTVHVTDMIRSGPVLHHTDLASLKAFAEKSSQHVDYVNVSFCRSADDLHKTRAQLQK